MKRFFLSASLLVLLASPAFAQTSLKLEIQDGRVNLDAASVPARQILAEWAKVGGTKVVGAEKITGAPLTLKLVDMPERKALDIILRSVAGYMAAPRAAAAATPGASTYDRIVILATSTSAGSASSNNTASPNGTIRMPNNPGPMAGTERRVPPRPPGFPQPREADDEQQAEMPQDQPDNGLNQQQPVFTFPQPQVPGNQVFMPVQPGQTPPPITLQPNQNGTPTIYNFMPNTGTAGAPPPTGTFNVIGSPTPGMIQQPTPTPGQRPPGGR